ncbi:lysis protein [Xenorhabdus budapestensis]|uniref:lysis protein n=1 Tax=Xenorhabdus budapestensis TaxID=290110 RepID=UPI003A8BD9F1
MSRLVALGAAVMLVVLYIMTRYQASEITNLTSDKFKLETQLSEQLTINATQQERIQQLHELDKTHTQELAHAKTEINTLRADVAAGRRKLRIKAACPMSETTSSGDVVNGTPVELTGETGSTVLDIREGIINDRAKLRYLQEYVSSEVRHSYGN